MNPIYPSGLDNASPKNALMAFRTLARENGRMRDYPATSKEAVSNRLVWTRLASGLNQAEFSKKIGIDARTWNNYELGISRISIDVALKVCTGTGVGLDWIYRGDESMLPHRLIEGIHRARDGAMQDQAMKKQRAGM